MTRVFQTVYRGWIHAIAHQPWRWGLAIALSLAMFEGRAIAQPIDSDCPPPALSQLRAHRATDTDTLASIAQQYNLNPATLMGLNLSLRQGTVPPGSEIIIPPYDGTLVAVPVGTTWQELASTYGVRADALFEANGCRTVPQRAYIPGVEWSPDTIQPPRQDTNPRPRAVFEAHPLPIAATQLTPFGWRLDPVSSEIIFHSGVDLAVPGGTIVQAVEAGTVAFAGDQGEYGNLVVVNHARGLQTRYAQLEGITVEVGQTVVAGQQLGTVGQTGNATTPHLHFEVRSNSSLGWVAESPNSFYANLEQRP